MHTKVTWWKTPLLSSWPKAIWPWDKYRKDVLEKCDTKWFSMTFKKTLKGPRCFKCLKVIQHDSGRWFGTIYAHFTPRTKIIERVASSGALGPFSKSVVSTVYKPDKAEKLHGTNQQVYWWCDTWWRLSDGYSFERWKLNCLSVWVPLVAGWFQTVLEGRVLFTSLWLLVYSHEPRLCRPDWAKGRQILQKTLVFLRLFLDLNVYRF